MIIQRFLPVFLLITALAIPSCGNDPVSATTGQIAGYVLLGNNNQLATVDRSGVEVSIVGTDLKGTTDAEGKWSIDDVPSGNHILEYHKDGYSWMRQYVQFVGSGTLYTPNTLLVPDAGFPITDVEATPFSNGASTVTVTVPKVQSPVQNVIVGLWMFTTPTLPDSLTSDQYVGIVGVQGFDNDSIAVNEYSATTRINASKLIDLGATSGSTVYLMAFPAYQIQAFNDPDRNRTVYTSFALSGSKVIEVVVP